MTKTGRLGACLSLLALGLLSLARPAKSEPVTEDGLPPRTTYPVGKSLFYPASGQPYLRNRSFETGLVPWDIYGVLWDEVAWQIDPSDAFHGQRSLRIVSPALRDGSKNSFFVKSNRFYAKRGQTFTFSAYMRSDQEMFPVAMNIIGHSQSGGSQRVLVGRDWRRYSVAITIPDKGRGSRKNCYQAVVNPLGKGTLWVDMLQLDEGTQAKPPKEDPVLWFGYQLEGDKAFHLPGEQVTTALFVRNGTQQPSKGSLAITVTDYFDRQVQNQVFPLTVEPGQTLSLRFTNRGGRGYYRVGMRLLPEDGSLLQKEHVNFVRARVPWEPGAPFFGLPGGRDLKALERLSEWGLHGAVRVICNGGGLMEAGEVIAPERIDRWEREINAWIGQGMTPTVTLQMIPEVPGESSDYGMATMPAPGSADEETMLKSWEAFVRLVGTRLRGKVRQWLIWVSCNVNIGGTLGQYVRLTEIASRTLKQIDPENYVVGSTANSDAPFEWADQVLLAGGGDSVDAMSCQAHIHGYPEVGGWRYAIDERIGGMAHVLAAHGVSKDIWIDEISKSGIDRPTDAAKRPFSRQPTEMTMANWFSRDMVVSYALGVKRFIQFTLSLGSHGNLGDCDGMFDFDTFRSPKKVAMAMDTFRMLVYGGAFERQLDFGIQNVRAYEFLKEGRHVIAVWTIRGEDTVLLEYLGPPEEVEAFDIQGTPLPLNNAGSLIPVRANESITFVRGKRSFLIKDFITLGPATNQPLLTGSHQEIELTVTPIRARTSLEWGLVLPADWKRENLRGKLVIPGAMKQRHMIGVHVPARPLVTGWRDFVLTLQNEERRSVRTLSAEVMSPEQFREVCETPIRKLPFEAGSLEYQQRADRLLSWKVRPCPDATIHGRSVLQWDIEARDGAGGRGMGWWSSIFHRVERAEPWSAYTGIRFWARTSTPFLYVRVEVFSAEGGKYVSRKVLLTESWQLVNIPLGQLQRIGWTTPETLAHRPVKRFGLSCTNVFGSTEKERRLFVSELELYR